MKANIEFELPEDRDAYLEAVEGGRWKDFVCDIEQFLVLLEATEPNPDAHRAYQVILRRMRHERGMAGLTLCSAAVLDQISDEHRKRCSEKLESYLQEKGYSFRQSPVCGQSASSKKRNREETRAAPQQPRVKPN